MTSARNHRADEVYYCAECGWVPTPGGFRGRCAACLAPITAFRCSRCGHAWWPRSGGAPGCCPRCKSPYWNRMRMTRGRRGIRRNDNDNYIGGDDSEDY